MATTNFKVFNEANTEARTFSDGEYNSASQRLNGVTGGMAISRLHNKLYLQSTAMAKAIADAIVANGDNCLDNDIAGITAGFNKLINDIAINKVDTHNTSNDAHSDIFATKAPLNSPNLTGTPLAPTAAAGTSTKQIASTEFVQNAIKSATPTGVIFPFMGVNIPEGYLLCNGQAVSRTTYAALFSIIGTRYGAGNGSTTFNVPNLIDRFLQGAASSGQVKNAGLPNIVGTFRANDFVDDTAVPITSGAIYVTQYTGRESENGSSGKTCFQLNFDASRSNSTYGKSATVQPPALTCLYIIKY